jgi:hypothetical protein
MRAGNSAAFYGADRQGVAPEVDSVILELATSSSDSPGKWTRLYSFHNMAGSISYRDVTRVSHLRDLNVGDRRKKEAPRYRCRYQANYANVIWHADLRFLHKNKATRSLVIARIDDRSRTCPECRFITGK